MILQALQHAPITLYNDGTQIRAWCFVEDFVDGVLRCAERPEAIGQAFNLGNPQGTITNFELANMILRLTNSKSDDRLQAAPGPRGRSARAVDREGGGSCSASARRSRSRRASRARFRGTPSIMAGDAKA